MTDKSRATNGASWADFDAAYAKACESSQPADWHKAAMYAQQIRFALSESALKAEADTLFPDAKFGAVLNEDGSITPARPASCAPSAEEFRCVKCGATSSGKGALRCNIDACPGTVSSARVASIAAAAGQETATVENLLSAAPAAGVAPAVPLEGAPRELWLAKGRLSGQWEHHAFREPSVEGWQRYVREDLNGGTLSATERTTERERKLVEFLLGIADGCLAVHSPLTGDAPMHQMGKDIYKFVAELSPKVVAADSRSDR